MTQIMITIALFTLPVAFVLYRLRQTVKIYRNKQPYTDNFSARLTRNYREQINKAMKLAKRD